MNKRQRRQRRENIERLRADPNICPTCGTYVRREQIKPGGDNTDAIRLFESVHEGEAISLLPVRSLSRYVPVNMPTFTDLFVSMAYGLALAAPVFITVYLVAKVTIPQFAFTLAFGVATPAYIYALIATINTQNELRFREESLEYQDFVPPAPIDAIAQEETTQGGARYGRIDDDVLSWQKKLNQVGDLLLDGVTLTEGNLTPLSAGKPLSKGEFRLLKQVGEIGGLWETLENNQTRILPIGWEAINNWANGAFRHWPRLLIRAKQTQ